MHKKFCALEVHIESTHSSYRTLITVGHFFVLDGFHSDGGIPRDFSEHHLVEWTVRFQCHDCYFQLSVAFEIALLQLEQNDTLN